MTPEDEYRLLFQTTLCNRVDCDHVADGNLTDLCKKHENEWAATPQKESPK